MGLPVLYDITATLDGRAVGFQRNGVLDRLDGAFFDAEAGTRDTGLDRRFDDRPGALSLQHSPTPFGHEVAFLQWTGADDIKLR